MDTNLTIAEQIAERFDQDGANFFDGNDTSLDDACRERGGCYEQQGYTVGYRFADDSAILISGDAWDVESDTHYFVWRSEEDALDLAVA